MMHSLSERPDLNLNVWVGSVQARLALWAARWVQSQSHCMLTPHIKPCQWVLVLWALVPSHMFSNKDSSDKKFKPLKEQHPEKGVNIGTSGQGVVEMTCKPRQRTTADLTRLSVCVHVQYIWTHACLSFSLAAIGRIGRNAPSGLWIRTLTSINISASFLYRSVFCLSHFLSSSSYFSSPCLSMSYPLRHLFCSNFGHQLCPEWLEIYRVSRYSGVGFKSKSCIYIFFIFTNTR